MLPMRWTHRRRTVAMLAAGWAVMAASVLRGAEPSESSAEREQARAILDASGIRGGLVVHLGCGDGRLTAALRAGPGFLVHGLASAADTVEQARRRIQELGGYGPVSVDRCEGKRLPYVDNLANLVVVETPEDVVMEEVLRVLAPGGVACVRRSGQWHTTVKPPPAEIDAWPHALYDASNNCLSRDAVVGPPQHLQWVAEPRNARHHETLSSVSAVVSAGGRLFSILDEGPAASIQLPADWQLVARDAFNGVLLWKRPIASWESHLRGGQDGPPGLYRRLVADGDRVYVTLGLDAPVAALDAATGATLATLADTEGTEEILLDGGVLYLALGAAAAEGEPAAAAAGRQGARFPRAEAVHQTVMAVEAATGRVRWKRTDAQPLRLSLALSGERIFWLAPDAVVCADAKTGTELWRTPRTVARQRPDWSAPTVVAQPAVLLVADRRPAPTPDVDESTGRAMPRWLAEGGAAGDLVAYSTATGQPLWTAPCGEVYHSAIDVFVRDGEVWLGQSRARQGPDFSVARDLLTGEVKQRISTEPAYRTTMPHHRCHRNRATARYLVTGRTGVEFIDLQTGAASRHHWVRGACQFGVIPANGLLYAPPHACACYIEAKLTGFNCLAPGRADEAVSGAAGEANRDGREEDGRLVRGMGTGASVEPNPVETAADDWPTYRHDAARSGRASTTVSADLKCAWQTTVGGRLTSPVVAQGLVLVAAIEAHMLHAFDARDGKPLWQFTAGGRIDSPPTVANGRAVFGAADGWVYCLELAGGRLAWRYRAAPDERRVVAHNQLESPWPVHGSVLVRDGAVYCAAGRSSYLDGGIWLVRLDLQTGRRLAQRRLYSRDQQTGEQPAEPIIFEMPGALPDVLSCDGQLLYMRHLAFRPDDLAPQPAPAHLYSPAGFLNDDWWHRNYWIFGTHFYSGYIGWYFAGRETPAGRMLVLDDSAILGFGYTPEFYGTSTRHRYHLFAVDRRTLPPQPPADYARANRDYPAGGGGKLRVQPQWSRECPLLARAMLLAGDTLFLAGPPTGIAEPPPTGNGGSGGLLSAVSAGDGQTRAEYRLDAQPVFDSLAAAQGRLYLTLQDGRLLCLSDRRATPGGTDLPRVPISGR